MFVFAAAPCRARPSARPAGVVLERLDVPRTRACVRVWEVAEGRCNSVLAVLHPVDPVACAAAQGSCNCAHSKAARAPFKCPPRRPRRSTSLAALEDESLARLRRCRQGQQRQLGSGGADGGDVGLPGPLGAAGRVLPAVAHRRHAASRGIHHGWQQALCSAPARGQGNRAHARLRQGKRGRQGNPAAAFLHRSTSMPAQTRRPKFADGRGDPLVHRAGRAPHHCVRVQH